MCDETETNANTSQSGTPHASGTLLKWLDVSAKLIGAVAIASVTYVVDQNQSKASLSSVVNQREQAESQLRASMLGDLVEPIIGQNGATSEGANLERQRLLAEMVTLNFHDHFEFKPLLEEVDARLLEANEQRGHEKIASVARRVVDRQINMLTSIDGVPRKGDTDGYEAKVTRIDLLNSNDMSPPADCTVESDDSNNRDKITIQFGKPREALICLSSPDDKICLLIRLGFPDYTNKTLIMRTSSYQNNIVASNCKSVYAEMTKNHDDIRQSDEIYLSIFDFPLTDNTKVTLGGDEYRYSVSLYSINTAERPIALKVVWFPQGYITERERPMINQAQFAKFFRSR